MELIVPSYSGNCYTKIFPFKWSKEIVSFPHLELPMFIIDFVVIFVFFRLCNSSRCFWVPIAYKDSYKPIFVE